MNDRPGSAATRRGVERVRAAAATDGAALAIIALPFVFYVYVVSFWLVPSHYPDTFAYIWRAPLSWSFLTGRSLTQRALFSLSRRSNHGIALMQLAGLLACALGLYANLRTRRPVRNAILASVIAFAFASYSLNAAAAEICAEVLHVALVVVFPIALMRSTRALPLLVAGALFIFSKSSAPYATLALVACAAALRRPWSAKLTRVSIALVALATTSIVVTRTFDESVQLNVLDNACARVFPFPEVTRHFHEKYGMPLGSFVQACAGGNVTTRCFDGEALLRIDERTRNYTLAEDRYGFVRWARSRGFGAYVRYLLWDAPARTARESIDGFESHFSGTTVRFLIQYLAARPVAPAQSNLERLSRGDPARTKGYLGFDPLTLFRDVERAMGFGSISGAVAYVAVALLLLAVRPTDGLRLGIVLVVNALLLFFVDYFGGGMEFERHVLPAIVAYVEGAMVLVVAIASWLLTWAMSARASVGAREIQVTTRL